MHDINLCRWLSCVITVEPNKKELFYFSWIETLIDCIGTWWCLARLTSVIVPFLLWSDWNARQLIPSKLSLTFKFWLYGKVIDWAMYMDHRWWCSADSLWSVLRGCSVWVVVEQNGFLSLGFIHGTSPTKDCGCLCSHTYSSKFLTACVVLFCLKNCIDSVFIKLDEFFYFLELKLSLNMLKWNILT
jgi:hypothetical protein